MPEPSLVDLGWSDHFARQVSPDATVARIAEVQRDSLSVLTPEGPVTLAPSGSSGGYAVGDWVEHAGGRVLRRLEPRSEIARRAAGTGAERQLIAANVDTLGIVTSCNADFNPARLERYLALAESSGCLPLVVLTKVDQTEDPAGYLRQTQRLSPLVTALALDARVAEEVARLDAWLRPGMTLALLGSSGVGKTTLQNALTGIEAATRGIREDDARGRHTTTSRSLRRATAGGWLIDTPGIRELRLADAGEAIDAVFADVTDLVAACRFGDCAHETEPGCAVQAAISAGTLDPGRLERWRKLQREDRFYSETLSETRARTRGWGKRVKRMLAEKDRLDRS